MAGSGSSKKLDAEGLWDYALRSLARRSQSSGELRTKLSRRARTPQDVSETLAKLAEYGYADDVRFSESFATARLENSKFGKFRVLRDLQAKRVPSSVARSAVDKTYAGVPETDLIRGFLARKYRGKDLRSLLKSEKEMANAYRRLRTAGFTSRESIAALRNYAKDVPEWEEPGGED